MDKLQGNVDATQTTTPVLNYLEMLKRKLSQSQQTNARKLVQTTKAELKQSVQSQSLNELKKFRKHEQLEILSDSLHAKMPDIPRDIFRRKLLL